VHAFGAIQHNIRASTPLTAVTGMRL
jgi:hypothetical protein